MHLSDILTFSFIMLLMALSPGPNMIYVVSRGVCQGRKAGLISLAGVGTGSCIYMLSTVCGLTAILFAAPIAYDIIKWCGALYLLYLAWNALKPRGKSPFQLRDLPTASPKKLYLMGIITNLLNPKMAAIYLSILPPFIHPQEGDVFLQSITLGTLQIIIGVVTSGTIMLSAHHVTRFFNTHPRAILIQRWLMGMVLIFLAMHILFAAR
jgi:threonine/homoserine/homoserine lactone efflux protein